MKKSKNILIVGTGILGCLMKIRIYEKFKNYNVLLVSVDDKILKSNDSIQFGNTIHNGFHALDVQRCKNLIKFYQKVKIKFFKEKLNRYISINGEIEKRTSLKSKNKI